MQGYEELMQFVEEENVEFIRLAYFDVFGHQKNIALMSGELERAVRWGVSIDGSAIDGFDTDVRSDLFLKPDLSTISIVPWRPSVGRVCRIFCDVTWPGGTPFEGDTRYILRQAVRAAAKRGIEVKFGSEMEFYVFRRDEKGQPTTTPIDRAGYMDIAPDDQGESIRRDICLTLEQMGIRTESSHHEEGPGQNEIDFRYSNALAAADHAQTFQRVVKTIASRYGLCADFSPKPLENAAGNGFHINISMKPFRDDLFSYMIAGILANVRPMTVFMNPQYASYNRLGSQKAPGYVSWSAENRSQLVRIPAAIGEYRRAELRSPDPCANPYLAFALMIYAALDGIENQRTLPEPADINLYLAEPQVLSRFEKLPASYAEACAAATASDFIKTHIPERILSIYCNA